MEKVFMWREIEAAGWTEYDDDIDFDIDGFEVGIIYTYEYKVIEREES